MQVVVSDIIHNQQYLAYSQNAGFLVGSAPACQIVLDKSRFVASRHFAVDREDDGWVLRVDAAASAVLVDDHRIGPGESTPLRPISEVSFPGYSLRIVLDEEEDARAHAGSARRGINQLQRDIHRSVLERMELRQADRQIVQADHATVLKIGQNVDSVIQEDFRSELGPGGTCRQEMLLLAVNHRFQQNEMKAGARSGYILPGVNPVLEKLAREYDRDIFSKLGLKETASAEMVLPVITESLTTTIAGVLQTMPENLQVYLISKYIKKIVCDLVFGFGPLQDLLDVPGLSEIMVVSPTQVYVEQNGVIHKTNSTFLGDDALMAVLERIVAPLGRRIDRTTPLVDARLPDGSRVNAIIPPLALKGPCLTIRRFPAEQITTTRLLEWNAITPQALELLSGVIRARKNLIIAGGTGSGKTTMLNALSTYISPEERIVTIEDSAELQLQHEHLVSLESRTANVEGKGEITIRDLIKNALRMRPDRIIVGECRGAEAFDMLQAMNTGHNGSMTTVHANSPQDVMTRLESMCLMAVDIPLQSIRQQISQAVDVIVYLERLPTGQRMVTGLAETGGLHPQTGEILTRLIMKANYDADCHAYQLENNGYIPTVLTELEAKGLVDVTRIFSVDPDASTGEEVAACNP